MTTWYESRIIKIEAASPTVRRFWLEIEEPNEPPFAFRAGQFVTFDLPISERRQKRWRSYSIANAPENDGRVLEFCVVKMEGGAGSTFLFEGIEIGSKIKFRGPDGAFFLPETIETDLVFIATGTGVAPFRSMIFDLKNTTQPHKNLHLIFGTRTADGILYRSEFEKLAAEDPRFRFDVALSRDPNWAGTQGHVHQIYLENYATARPDVHFYLCGWSNMIDEAVANLLVRLGYERGQIHYELYG